MAEDLKKFVDRNGDRGEHCYGNLSSQVLYPTPTDPSKGGGSSRSGNRINEIPSLQGMARKNTWPTPTKQDAHKEEQKFATPQSRDHRTGEHHRWEDKDRSFNLNDQIGGKLNPAWVELLMGWPKNWTSLKPLNSEDMAKFDNCDWWNPDWEEGTVRVIQGTKHRVNRLKAIGNGQVPATAAMAWKLLTVDLEID